MASHPVSFRLIDRPDMLKKLASDTKDWDALLGNMALLKGKYAEIERALDEEDARAGQRRYVLFYLIEHRI